MVNHTKEKFVKEQGEIIMAETQTTQTTETNTEIDYKAEYEKFEAEKKRLNDEIEKQKKLKDDYAKENAEYKKQKQAQMSDEQKREQEIKDMNDSNAKLLAEVNQLKLERECLANNFSTEETKIFVDNKIPFEAIKPIAELIKGKVDEAVKSAKAEETKNSTSQGLAGKGTATKGEKSDFQLYQESRKSTSNEVKL